MTAARATPMALVAIGAIAAALLVGRPAGLGVSLVAIALLALAKPRGGWGILFWIGAAALASVATVRAAGWIVWPSLVFAVALGSLAAAGGAAWWPVVAGIARAARLDKGLELVARSSSPPRLNWLTGAGITVVLLAVFVPLFATADAAFAHLLGELVPDDAVDLPAARLVDLPAARLATWIGVIAAAARWGNVSRLLLGALCVLTLVVLASALTRLGLYMEAYGFTRLRLTAEAVILWLGALFALLLIAGGRGWLPRATVAVTAAAMLAFAISNPDRRVATKNLEHRGPVDERVLRDLSADAAPVLPCRMRPEIERDGVMAFNLGRSQARAATCTP